MVATRAVQSLCMPDIASIDQCGNCRYWERVSPARGICHIISEPARFQNGIAFITLDLAQRAGRKPVNAGVLFMPAEGFHCTLYKFKK